MALQLKHPFKSSIPRQKTQPEHPFYAAKKFQVNATSSTGRQLIESGTIRAILPKDASMAINSEGFTLLDVRPKWEREKARVVGSVHVPIFVEDMDNSLVTLIKKWVHFGYIGLWTGQYLTTINSDFLSQVEAAVSSKDSKLLVACGEGLRSITAASKLYEGGYRNLGWLAGGFNRARENDFPAVEGKEKLQFATIGGVSYYFLQLLVLLQAVGKGWLSFKIIPWLASNAVYTFNFFAQYYSMGSNLRANTIHARNCIENACVGSISHDVNILDIIVLLLLLAYFLL